jgi:hypothetical protein
MPVIEETITTAPPPADRFPLPGQALGRGGQAHSVTGDEPDRRSLGGQRPRHREADAAASAGDQRSFSVQA